MKVIVSHDIDHITASEHYFKDLIIPKHLVRTKIELLTGKISFSELSSRYLELLHNKLHNRDDLQEFNSQYGVPNSFFIGVQNGLGLSYSLAQAKAAVQKLIACNSKVYLHGINYETFEGIKKEKNIFENEFNIAAKGIRMHYVRNNETTFQKIADAGYLFDSTTSGFKNPYKIGNMWEFPIQIMDGWIIEAGKRRQTRSLHESKEETKKIIDKAHSMNLSHLGVDFHDRYFSNSFKPKFCS